MDTIENKDIQPQEIPQKKTRWTLRQRKYKANRIKGMNQYNSAIAAGYSEGYAHDHAYLIERSVKSGIIDALERAGLTDKTQANALKELTEATKIISCNIFIDKDGQMKTADGKTMDFIEVPDPALRLRTWEHIAELKKQLLKDATVIQQIMNMGKTDGDISGADKDLQQDMLGKLGRFFV